MSYNFNTLLRNIGIIAHVDAGKTTFTERILFITGAIKRVGAVHEGTTTTDFLPEERDRGITIAAAAVSCKWKNCLITIVDTPGHLDFTIEVERSLRVLDAAIGVFCGVKGVEPQSEKVWRQAECFGIPKIAVINKLDREGANFSDALLSMESVLGIRVLPVTIPWIVDGELVGVLDLIHQKKISFTSLPSEEGVKAIAFTEAESVIAKLWMPQIFDLLTEDDDHLLTTCLEGKTPLQHDLILAIRKGTMQERFVPVYAVSALKNIGIQPVLDGIIDFLPSPDEVSVVSSLQIKSSVSAQAQCAVISLKKDQKQNNFLALVFKVFATTGNESVFIRVYTGSLKIGDSLFNVRTKQWEVVIEIFKPFAEEKEYLEAVYAGDIVAIKGVNARTGDTLSKGSTLELEPVAVNLPVISMVLEPRTMQDSGALEDALRIICLEDPTVHIHTKDGRILASGMGELHLEVLRDRLQREFKIDVRLGNPHVVCREVLQGSNSRSGEFRKITGEEEVYGALSLEVTPSERCHEGTEVVFLGNAAKAAQIIQEVVKEGVKEACVDGNFGFPVVQCRINIVTIAIEKSTLPGLQIAAKTTCQAALQAAGTTLEEPLMQVLVVVPNDFLGSVTNLLTICGANITNCISTEHKSEVSAVAPLRKLFGFSTRLRSVSQGRADVSMAFSAYGHVDKGWH